MSASRIDVSVGLERGSSNLSDKPPFEPRREASESDSQAFERALEDPVPTALPAGVGGPFMFLPAGASGVSESGSEAPLGLSEQLSEVAQRLLVADGLHGRREVRIELKADVLPGVSLSIFEDAGRLVVAFSSTHEISSEKLAQCAQPLANGLAASLRRKTLVRVQEGGLDGACLSEVQGMER